MKKQKNKRANPHVRRANRDSRATAQQRATAAAPEPLESALGMAALIAEPYPEEAEAIENVIRFVRGHRHGQLGDVRHSDVLLALSILITALDRDPTPEERQMFVFLDTLLGVSPRGVRGVPATVQPYASSVAAPQRPRPLASHHVPMSSSRTRLAA
jgi:hypothetical protein